LEVELGDEGFFELVVDEGAGFGVFALVFFVELVPEGFVVEVWTSLEVIAELELLEFEVIFHEIKELLVHYTLTFFQEVFEGVFRIFKGLD
jgi:hypothetical protein